MGLFHDLGLADGGGRTSLTPLTSIRNEPSHPLPGLEAICRRTNAYIPDRVPYASHQETGDLWRNQHEDAQPRFTSLVVGTTNPPTRLSRQAASDIAALVDRQ